MKKLFLLIFLVLNVLVCAASPVQELIPLNSSLKDLEGTVDIDVIYDYTCCEYDDHAQAIGANIVYSGDEDVTMTIAISGFSYDLIQKEKEVVDSIHGKEWYFNLIEYNYNFYIEGVIEITVHSEGYNDLVQSVDFYNDYAVKRFRYMCADKVGAPMDSGNCYVSGNRLICGYNFYAYLSFYEWQDHISHDYQWVTACREFSGAITIPSSVSEIGDNSLAVYCGSISGKGNQQDYYDFPYFNGEMEDFNTVFLTVPSSIRTIAGNAFGVYSDIDPFYEEVQLYPYRFYGVRIEDFASWCAIDFKGPECNPLIYSSHFYINDQEVQELSIPDTISRINDYALQDCGFVSVILPVSVSCGNHVFGGSHVGSLMITGNGAFMGGSLDLATSILCVDEGVNGIEGLQIRASNIYCYASTPPTCDSNTFTDYSATLHVPASSLAAYFTAPYWCNFLNIVGDAVEPTEVRVNTPEASMIAGDNMTISANVFPESAMPNSISWSTTNSLVAVVDAGRIHAVGKGECDIIASCGGKHDICHISVLDPYILLDRDSIVMEKFEQIQLYATPMMPQGMDYTVYWSSSNENIALVDNGTITAVGTGECDIIAKIVYDYDDDGNEISCWAICHVVVVEQHSVITLDQHNASVLPNHIITITPTVTPVSTDLVVTSSNPEVAAARLAGDKIQVVGIKEGVATIYVNSADGYAEPDSCRVTVKTERGDVNGDGFVSISDVTTLIDVLLGGDDGDYYEENADCNNDGMLSIGDVTILIDALLGGAVLPGKDTEEFTVNGVSFSMVKVQGGTFMMGATPEQGSEVRDNEKPVHQVTLSDYIIGQTEVTQELWLAVMGENPSHHTGDLKRPVEQVSWEDCQRFITQLNQLTGKTFRLPTEAEWEYAARGGNKSEGYMFAGSNVMDLVAWYNANSGNTTHPVATKAPNELGLYDMTGNVWEWCYDWYKRYTEEPQVNPTGPATGNNRVLRGGCWNGGGNYNRISYRDNFTPTGSNSSGGLRLVLDNNEEFTVNGVTFTMVKVQGGTFTMGATPGQGESAYDDESPAHQVTLSTYSIGQTEVTQALWQAVMGSNPSKYIGDMRPVETVSWEDCQTFISTLNQLTGRTFRLPTEAEWEFAARGGNMSHDYKYAGSDDLDEVGWYISNLPSQQSGSEGYGHQPVAQKKANELGLYDMSGNVYEWTNDWYDAYSADSQVDPTGPGDDEGCHYRVCRGGAWTRNARSCRVTLRNNPTPVSAYNNIGFRLAL